jgi:hypothetical protein
MAASATGNKPPNKSTSPTGGGGGFSLGMKVGPLPLWGWIVALGAGYLLYKHFAGSSSSSSTTGATTGSTTATGEPSETVTEPGGYSYTGPATGQLPGLSTTGTGVTTPGTTGTSPTPGSGGNSTTSDAYPGYTQIAPNTPQTANQVATLLQEGQPVYGASAPGAPLVPITSPGGGGEWQAGGQPLPPGSQELYFVPSPGSPGTVTPAAAA